MSCLEEGAKTPFELLSTVKRWGSQEFHQYTLSLKKLADKALENATEAEQKHAKEVRDTSQSIAHFYHDMQVELSFKSVGLLVGSWSPTIFHFAYQISNFFPLVVLAWRPCLNLNEEQPILVHQGPNAFLHLLTCQIKFSPLMNQYRMFLAQTPHYLHLQACTKNLPNMESTIRKTINSQLKVMLT